MVIALDSAESSGLGCNPDGQLISFKRQRFAGKRPRKILLGYLFLQRAILSKHVAEYWKFENFTKRFKVFELTK